MTTLVVTLKVKTKRSNQGNIYCEENCQFKIGQFCKLFKASLVFNKDIESAKRCKSCLSSEKKEYYAG